MVNRWQTDIKDKIYDITTRRGVDLVEYKFFMSGKQAVIRCLVDYPEGGITIDECAAINKEIVVCLEQSNMGEDFVVEVNSPGLDRKLIGYKDFLRLKGELIGLWLNEPVEGKEYIEGEICDVDEQRLVLKNKDKTFEIDFTKIKAGKKKNN